MNTSQRTLNYTVDETLEILEHTWKNIMRVLCVECVFCNLVSSGGFISMHNIMCDCDVLWNEHI